MVGTKRVPIARQANLQVTPRALELFEQVEKARRQRRAARCIVGPYGHCRGDCTPCRSWYELQDQLHVELGLKPRFWPCVPCNPFPPGSLAARDWSPEGAPLQLWQTLERGRQAAEARAVAAPEAPLGAAGHHPALVEK